MNHPSTGYIVALLMMIVGGAASLEFWLRDLLRDRSDARAWLERYRPCKHRGPISHPDSGTLYVGDDMVEAFRAGRLAERARGDK